MSLHGKTPDSRQRRSNTRGSIDHADAMLAVETGATMFDVLPLERAAAQELPGMAEITGTEARDYLESSVCPILSQALMSLCLVRPPNPIDYLALYLTRNNPYKSPENRGDFVEVPTDEQELKPVVQE